MNMLCFPVCCFYQAKIQLYYASFYKTQCFPPKKRSPDSSEIMIIVHIHIYLCIFYVACGTLPFEQLVVGAKLIRFSYPLYLRFSELNGSHFPLPFRQKSELRSMAIYFSSIFQAYVRGYTPRIWPKIWYRYGTRWCPPVM